MTEQELVWVVDNDWVVLSQPDRRLCRYFGGSPRAWCRESAVAILDRSTNKALSAWWAYCEKHLYGCRLVGNHVERLTYKKLEGEAS